jgi:hypothetical protein
LDLTPLGFTDLNGEFADAHILNLGAFGTVIAREW